MDCLGSPETWRHAAYVAGSANIPFIHGAVAGEEGFAMALLPGDSTMRLLQENAPSSGENGAEAHLGVPTLTPAAIAVLQVNLAVHLLAGRTPNAACLYHFDLSGPRLETLEPDDGG